jgi:hypothetical protein
MKKTLLSFLTLILTAQVFAQRLTIRIGSHEPVKSNSWTVPVQNFATVAEGEAIVDDILDAVNRRANFELRSTTSVANAAAVTYGGKRYVLYNPNFIRQLDRASGNRWASISVMAHEVGHHLEGHTDAGQGSHPAIELEADEFSGYALRKMGASLQDAQSAMQLIASQRASSTHPGKHNRLSAIENGWSMANREMGGSMAKTKPAPPSREYPQRQPGGQTRNPGTSISLGDILIGVLGQVLSRNVQQGGFVVNEQQTVLRRAGNGWTQIGKLVKTNNSRIPYMISGNGSQYYVDPRGNILNRAGQILGLLQSLR